MHKLLLSPFALCALALAAPMVERDLCDDLYHAPSGYCSIHHVSPRPTSTHAVATTALALLPTPTMANAEDAHVSLGGHPIPSVVADAEHAHVGAPVVGGGDGHIGLPSATATSTVADAENAHVHIASKRGNIVPTPVADAEKGHIGLPLTTAISTSSSATTTAVMITRWEPEQFTAATATPTAVAAENGHVGVPVGVPAENGHVGVPVGVPAENGHVGVPVAVGGP